MNVNNLMAHILEPIKEHDGLKKLYLEQLDCPRHVENTLYNSAECDECTHYHDMLDLLN